MTVRDLKQTVPRVTFTSGYNTIKGWPRERPKELAFSIVHRCYSFRYRNSNSGERFVCHYNLARLSINCSTDGMASRRSNSSSTSTVMMDDGRCCLTSDCSVVLWRIKTLVYMLCLLLAWFCALVFFGFVLVLL